MDRQADDFSCTLSPADFEDRRMAWMKLGQAVIDGHRRASGFTVRYRRAPGVAEALHMLATAERDCCGWASWNVIDGEDACVLEVTGPADRIGPVAAAFGL